MFKASSLMLGNVSKILVLLFLRKIKTRHWKLHCYGWKTCHMKTTTWLYTHTHNISIVWTLQLLQ